MLAAVHADTDLEQSAIRTIACVLLGFYSLIAVQLGMAGASIAWMYLAAIPYCLIIIIWSRLDPGPNPERRLLGIVADVGTTSYALAAGGDALAPFIIVYYWLILGHGLRYGSRYLVLTSALCFFAFTAVLITSTYWSAVANSANRQVIFSFLPGGSRTATTFTFAAGTKIAFYLSVNKTLSANVAAKGQYFSTIKATNKDAIAPLGFGWYAHCRIQGQWK